MRLHIGFQKNVTYFLLIYNLFISQNNLLIFWCTIHDTLMTVYLSGEFNKIFKEFEAIV